MKKNLLALVAVLACTFGTLSIGSGQTALFSYNDGVGTPEAGTYHPGDSFTFSITLNFAPGGAIANLEGLSYWLQQSSPVGAPFNFTLTARDTTGSPFTVLQTPTISPQNLNPFNANDLGGALPPGPAITASGNYFIANITISIAPTALNGTYVIGNGTTPGHRSVISNSTGQTFAIPFEAYTITVVPEPGTWLAAGLTLTSLLAFHRHRRSARSKGA